jgi:tol-pal system protein YbgF
MKRLAVFALSLSMLVPQGAWAQDDQTLADIRQELNILYVEVQKLRRELSTTGTATVQTGGASTLERLNTMESELRRLTSKTEQLEFRVDSIVRDGTNRIGDLEFRLVELEGGDISALGETTTLGGGAAPTTGGQAAQPAAPSTGGDGLTAGIDTSQLAVNEEADFRRAAEALASGDFPAAANQFATFGTTYPGGPLGPAASLLKGEALEGMGDTREAAKAYLEAFTSDTTGIVAPDALYHLGSALADLGQTSEACVTLAEVEVRYPASTAVGEAQSRLSQLACN